jgi:hypothetical protein
MMIMEGFRILPITDRELFLRYAIPCGRVLVRRGDLKGEVLGRLNEAVKHGQDIDEPIEDVFKVASRMCTILAKRMGKNEIDSEVIRRYFLLEHDKAIAWRKQVKPDINAEECSVKPGKVLKVDDNNILVSTKLGEKLCRADFAQGLQRNDWVSVHYDYVDEKLSKNHMNRMFRGRI